jgi:hypothetical protein
VKKIQVNRTVATLLLGAFSSSLEVLTFGEIGPSLSVTLT